MIITACTWNKRTPQPIRSTQSLFLLMATDCVRQDVMTCRIVTTNKKVHYITLDQPIRRNQWRHTLSRTYRTRNSSKDYTAMEPKGQFQCYGVKLGAYSKIWSSTFIVTLFMYDIYYQILWAWLKSASSWSTVFQISLHERGSSQNSCQLLAWSNFHLCKVHTFNSFKK